MNKLYEENDIQAIANAIRGKNGSTDTYKVSEMATAIEGIPSGGNLEDFIPDEAFHISGNCSWRFAYETWDWFFKEYQDKITISDITDANRMFYRSRIEQLPVDITFADGGCTVTAMLSNCGKLKLVQPINFKQTTPLGCGSLFAYCYDLLEIGKLSNLYPSSISEIFAYCYRLRYLPEFENLNLSYIQTNTSAYAGSVFAHNYSLREIPEELLKQIHSVVTKNTAIHFYNMFYDCLVLDEIIGLSPRTETLTSNAFTATFYYNSRVKNIIFDTQEDGSPYSVNWKMQTISLSTSVGYKEGKITSLTTEFNSGITEDKQVFDDATYQALKNDPDWFTTDVNYSRYNHDSAVNTINSLPDTFEYLASAGGTNTIKFLGASGALTDGGAINTLTEEEIAVATAKGWTVTFA